VVVEVVLAHLLAILHTVHILAVMSEKQQERRQEKRRRFEEKTAIITGAAGDLGSTSARQLSEEGARVVLFDLPSTEAALKQLVTELGGKGSIYVCGDVTSVEDMKKSVQCGVDEFGGIDILYNCAGIGARGRVHEVEDEVFKKTMDVNSYGTFLMMKYISNKMIEAGQGGVIINASSQFGLVGSNFSVAYCASKFAVSGMTRAAAKSLAKHNIRVCAVAPTYLEGRLMQGYLGKLKESTVNSYL